MLHEKRHLKSGFAFALASQLLCVGAVYGQTLASACAKPQTLSKNWSNADLFRHDREQTAYIKCSSRESSEAAKLAHELHEKEMAERDKTLLERANAAKESVINAAKAAKEAAKDPSGFVASAINAKIGGEPAAGGQGKNPLLEGSKTMVEKAYDQRGSNAVANSVGKTSTFASIKVMEHAGAGFEAAVASANSSGTAASGFAHLTQPSVSLGGVAGPDPYDPKAAALSAQGDIAREQQAKITQRAKVQAVKDRADEQEYRLAVMTPQEKAERARQAQSYRDLVEHEHSRATHSSGTSTTKQSTPSTSMSKCSKPVGNNHSCLI